MSGREVFSRIAGRYDRLNRMLSLGRDDDWRRQAIAFLPPGRVLDLGAGTGAANPDLGDREIVALDPSSQMLALNPSTRRVVGKGERLPFSDGWFDGVFSAYVVRNLDSIPETLGEIARVLRPGGVAAIVDLGRPPAAWKRVLHRMGTAVVLPLAGATIGAVGEYRYLHRSLDSLPPPEEIYADGPLRLARVWRMGPMGFVYGVVLEKAPGTGHKEA
ncbi:MAG: class I SAM-dependent methyltransferase [Acidimicrobiia bacterium]|nr:class I SAM-dependent methyltransferase [Acidimicrobiia bacterium]